MFRLLDDDVLVVDNHQEGWLKRLFPSYICPSEQEIRHG